MARSLTSGLLTEIGNAVTKPGYFIEIVFSTNLRMSTRGTLSWNGNTWAGRGAVMSGIGNDVTTSAQAGRITFDDGDFAIAELVLSEGIAGRAINVWKFYGATPADGDPVQVFSGAGDSASLDTTNGKTAVALVQRGARELYAPRRYMTRANGFSVLPVTGKIITFNGENFKLTRYRG